MPSAICRISWQVPSARIWQSPLSVRSFRDAGYWDFVTAHLKREVVMGGYEAARYVHFVSMAFLVAFVGVHLAMVALVPRTLLAMIRGR